MIGDAYAFVDPVFSSGVYLAMQSAFDGAARRRGGARRPAATPQRCGARFDRDVQHGPREFSWFIFRVTNPTMREFFMAPQNPFRVKEALISLLAGDIYGRHADLAVDPDAQGALLPGLDRQPRAARVRAWRRRRVNIRDVEAQAS